MKQVGRISSNDSSDCAATWALSDDDDYREEEEEDATTSSDDTTSNDQKEQQQQQQQEVRIAELEALLAVKDERIAKLEAQIEAMKQHQHEGGDGGNRDEGKEDDSQLRDQIEAVKVSLQQGRHQAKETKESLNEELETCRRLQEKLANRKDIRAAAAAAAAAASAAARTTPPASPKRSVRQQQQSSSSSSSSPAKKEEKSGPSLTEQLAVLLTSVQEREQSMAEIAQSFHNQGGREVVGEGTLPVSLYQAEIQQWKKELTQLQAKAKAMSSSSSSSDSNSDSNSEDNNEGGDSSQSLQLRETLRQSNQLLQQANEKLQQMETDLSKAQQLSTEEQARSQSLWQVVLKLEQDKQDEIHLLDIVMQHLLELEEEQEKKQQQQQQQRSNHQSSPLVSAF